MTRKFIKAKTIHMSRLANQLNRLIHHILYALGSVILIACEAEEDQDTHVITEEVVYVSGEVVRLTGRVLSISGTGIQDHGFQISDNEAFSDPVVISLGGKSIPGRFYGETNILNLETDYYCRSFATTGGTIVVGNVKEFVTLAPDLSHFEPKVSHADRVLKIFGKNLSKDTRVFFGGREVEILDLVFESEVSIKIPPIVDRAKEPISVYSQGEMMHFVDSFEYVIGTWNHIENFIIEDQLLNTIGFKVDDEFIFGLGKNPWVFGHNNLTVWKRNLNTNEWSQIEFLGQRTEHGFQAGRYWGGGEAAGVSRAWYEYMPTGGADGNGALSYIGELPFELTKAKAFIIDEHLYVLGGIKGDGITNFDIHVYDIQQKTWDIAPRRIPFPIEREFPHFVYKNKAYIIDQEQQLWTYQPAGEVWEIIGKTPFTQQFTGFYGAPITEVIGNRGFVGVFFPGLGMWEYNFDQNIWKDKISFHGVRLSYNVGTYNHNGLIYTIRGSNRDNTIPMKMWEFDPDGLR